jgi:DNA invertase Pin-like site-specific DNA recombinase
MYERVSTGIRDVDRSQSVEDQNRDNGAAVSRRGWTVAGRYADPGLSASRFAKRARPEWERLLADIRAGRLDVVVMWASTRGSRELEAWAGFLNACRKHGVKIYVTKDDYLYDLANDRDWRYLASEGIESAAESDKISRQSQRGIASAALRGEPHGRIPYGYARRYEHDASHPKLRRPVQYPHPEESLVVAEVITRIAAGHSNSSLLADLRERGIMCRDGTPWVHSSLTAMAQNPIYIAKRRHNGGPFIDGNWPPLVEESVFWAATAVLSDPARKIQAEKRGGIRPGAARWLLSYLARCGVCDGPLNVKSVVRVAGNIPVYRCLKGCVLAPVTWLDELATVAVVGFCAKSPLFEMLTAGDGSEAATSRAEAQSERDRLREFEEQAISGELSAQAYARIASRLETRIAELEDTARRMSTPPPLRDLLAGVPGTATQAERWKEVHARWVGMPLTAKRSVIRAIFAPELHPAGRGKPNDPARFRCPPAPALIAETPEAEIGDSPSLAQRMTGNPLRPVPRRKGKHSTCQERRIGTQEEDQAFPPAGNGPFRK